MEEMHRRDAMLQAIQDPSTPEGAVAMRAHERLAVIAADVGMDAHTLQVRGGGVMGGDDGCDEEWRC